MCLCYLSQLSHLPQKLKCLSCRWSSPVYGCTPGLELLMLWPTQVYDDDDWQCNPTLSLCNAILPFPILSLCNAIHAVQHKGITKFERGKGELYDTVMPLEALCICYFMFCKTCVRDNRFFQWLFVWWGKFCVVESRRSQGKCDGETWMCWGSWINRKG